MYPFQQVNYFFTFLLFFHPILANEILQRGESWLSSNKKTLVSNNTLDIPTLMVHGTEDRLTSPDASKLAFDRLQNKYKKYISYPGAYHECKKEYLCWLLFYNVS